jgi:hypothetical protein
MHHRGPSPLQETPALNGPLSRAIGTCYSNLAGSFTGRYSLALFLLAVPKLFPNDSSTPIIAIIARQASWPYSFLNIFHSFNNCRSSSASGFFGVRTFEHQALP